MPFRKSIVKFVTADIREFFAEDSQGLNFDECVICHICLPFSITATSLLYHKMHFLNHVNLTNCPPCLQNGKPSYLSRLGNEQLLMIRFPHEFFTDYQ